MDSWNRHGGPRPPVQTGPPVTRGGRDPRIKGVAPRPGTPGGALADTLDEYLPLIPSTAPFPGTPGAGLAGIPYTPPPTPGGLSPASAGLPIPDAFAQTLAAPRPGFPPGTPLPGAPSGLSGKDLIQSYDPGYEMPDPEQWAREQLVEPDQDAQVLEGLQRLRGYFKRRW
jgi:hypothetical protein